MYDWSSLSYATVKSLKALLRRGVVRAIKAGDINENILDISSTSLKICYYPLNYFPIDFKEISSTILAKSGGHLSPIPP